MYNPGKKGATILVTRHSGDDYKFVKVVADKIIRPLLISLMSGLDGEKLAMEMFERQDTEVGQSKCNICDKMFKNKQGLTLHTSKMHGTFKTHPAIKRTSKGKDKCDDVSTGLVIKRTDLKYECKECKFKFSTKTLLDIHFKKVHQQSIPLAFTGTCELCNKRFVAGSRWKSIQDILKHKALMHIKVGTLQHRSKTDCDMCDFSSQSEVEVKRHMRDNHDILTKSTSPLSKKKRFLEPKDYKTQEKVEVVAELSDDFEAMDFEEKELKEISLKMDMKVLEKRKKDDFIEEEFRKFQFQRVQPELQKKAESQIQKTQDKIIQEDPKVKEFPKEKDSTPYKG